MSTNAKHPLLLDVQQERRRLEGEVIDLEWEGRDASFKKQQLQHYKRLEESGIIWEPVF